MDSGSINSEFIPEANELFKNKVVTKNEAYNILLKTDTPK